VNASTADTAGTRIRIVCSVTGPPQGNRGFRGRFLNILVAAKDLSTLALPSPIALDNRRLERLASQFTASCRSSVCERTVTAHVQHLGGAEWRGCSGARCDKRWSDGRSRIGSTRSRWYVASRYWDRDRNCGNLLRSR
jgi:hypothetical protein